MSSGPVSDLACPHAASFHLLYVSAFASRFFRPISRWVSRRRSIFVQSARWLQVDEKMYEYSLFLHIYAVIELFLITISVKNVFNLPNASAPALIRQRLTTDNCIGQLRLYGCLSSSFIMFPDKTKILRRLAGVPDIGRKISRLHDVASRIFIQHDFRDISPAVGGRLLNRLTDRGPHAVDGGWLQSCRIDRSRELPPAYGRTRHPGV